MIRVFLILIGTLGCSSFKNDNEPKDPPCQSETVATQLALYRPLVTKGLDDHGLAVMKGSIGDSALFSCLARVGGAATFDPAVLFTDGKPIRHPDINPGISDTPTSRDMVAGILWCLWDLHRKGETDHAIDLVQKMIAFGKGHPLTHDADVGWLFCTDGDRDLYRISDEAWFGKCFMTPAVIKDIYRVAKMVGVPCDETCQYYTKIGTNLPFDGTGFRRHLAVIATVRNGLVEGAINDNSLKIVLQNAADSQSRNALYQASFHLFSDGDQAAAFAALGDESLFPRDRLPTSSEYCSDYLFQRDQDLNDWVPCGADGAAEGRGIEWIFAASLALGEIH